MGFFILLYVVAVNGLVGRYVSTLRGRDLKDDTIRGAVFGPLAWIWILMQPDMRPWCPHCSTPRLPGASVCRACRREFGGT